MHELLTPKNARDLMNLSMFGKILHFNYLLSTLNAPH